MTHATECLACGSAALAERPARVAPFLARRIWNRNSFGVSFNACGSCGFEFFNPRMEGTEEARLYADYRSPSYQAQRQSFEPWYTEAFNRGLGSNDAGLAARAALISRLIAGRDVQSVLDFGGDFGQLAVRLPVPGKFVFDISGVEPLPGIVGFNSFPECASRSYDLITCAHVLEHVGDPVAIMRQIAQASQTETLIYLEVPNERRRESRITYLSHAVQSGIRALRNPRSLLATLKPGALCVMHEHVSKFNDASLRMLAERAGFAVIRSSADEAAEANPLGPVLWCLAARS